MPAKYQSINRIEKNKLIIKANNSENNSELLFWIKVRVTESDPIGDDIIYVKNIPWPFDIEAKLYKRRKLTNNVKFNKVFYNSSEKKLTIRFETSGEKNKGREKHAHFLKKFRKCAIIAVNCLSFNVGWEKCTFIAHVPKKFRKCVIIDIT